MIRGTFLGKCLEGRKPLGLFCSSPSHFHPRLSPENPLPSGQQTTDTRLLRRGEGPQIGGDRLALALGALQLDACVGHLGEDPLWEGPLCGSMVGHRRRGPQVLFFRVRGVGGSFASKEQGEDPGWSQWGDWNAFLGPQKPAAETMAMTHDCSQGVSDNV